MTISNYDTRLASTKLDFLSDVLKDFCEQQELPFMSADDILYGNKRFLIEGQLVTLRDTLTAYSTNWLEKYIQVWDVVINEEV